MEFWYRNVYFIGFQHRQHPLKSPTNGIWNDDKILSILTTVFIHFFLQNSFFMILLQFNIGPFSSAIWFVYILIETGSDLGSNTSDAFHI